MARWEQMWGSSSCGRCTILKILTVARDGGREIAGHSVDGTRVSGIKMSAPILLTGVTGDWQGGVIRVPYPYTPHPSPLLMCFKSMIVDTSMLVSHMPTLYTFCSIRSRICLHLPFASC